AGSGFSSNQDGGIRSCDRFHLLQDPLESKATPDNLLKVVLGPDLVFQVELFLHQLVFELLNLTIRQSILNSDGNLLGNLSEELHLIFGPGIFAEAAYNQDTQWPAMSDERDTAAGSETLFHEWSPDVRRKSLEIGTRDVNRLA